MSAGRWICTEQLEDRRMFDLTITGTVIDGVQSVALDQPRIHAFFRYTPGGQPLVAEGPGFQTFDVTAFLDTGSSGMLLSKETAEALGIGNAIYDGDPVIFSDVGVGGMENFHVSDQVYAALASFPNDLVDDLDTYASVYTQTYGPIRTQVAEQDADELLGPLDILGMPLLVNKVMVMDPKPVEEIDYLHTFVYDPGTPFKPDTQDSDPGIPTTNLHVPLTFADFSRFTLVTPADAPGPSLASNPFIGPDPTLKLLPNPPVDSSPPVVIGNGGFTSSGSFLFDTGAAASFISVQQAENVRVHYKEDTYGTDEPVLVDDNGVPIANQFVIPIGGVGGTLNAAGFFLDSLTLPTVEGQPITFKNAPVLVVDISVEDPETGQIITLDGDIGMNYLVASADISSGFPDRLEPGAFNWAVFDEPNRVLGLDLKGWTKETTAPTASLDVTSVNTAAGQMTFKVTYKDESAMNVSSIDSADVRVTGPGGYNQLATKVSTVTSAGNKSVVVTYAVPQPAGNGTFTLAMQNHQVTDMSDNAVAAVNIGSFSLASPAITGTVYKDANSNSQREVSDVGIAGWTVYLDANNNNVKDAGETFTTTDAQGRYAFSNLPAGTHNVKTVVQLGWRKTTPTGTPGFSVTLAGNQTAGAKDFGFTQNIMLSGTVYNDANKNGEKDAAEVGMSGWRVFVDLNNNGTFEAGEPARVTNDVGYFQFKGLTAGTGTVRVETQSGWTKSNPASGAYSGTVTSATIFPNLNYGLYAAAPAPLPARASADTNDELTASLITSMLSEF